MPPGPNHILADAIERWAKDAHSHSCGGDGLPNLDDYIGPQHNGWQDDNRFDWEAAASYNGTQGWEAGPLERAIEWGQKLNIDINSRIDDLRKRISEYSAFLSAYAPPVVATNGHECLDFSEQEKRIERLCGHAMRTAGWLRNAFIESIPKISIPAASIIAAKTLSILKLHEHVIESLSIVAAWRKRSGDDAARYAQEAVATIEKAFKELHENLESSDISGQLNRNTMNDLESAFQEISDGPFEWCGFTATSAHAAAWLVAYKLFYDDFMNYHASIDRFSDDNIALLQTEYAFNAKDLSRIETFIKIEEERLLKRGFKISVVGNPEQWNVAYYFTKDEPPSAATPQRPDGELPKTLPCIGEIVADGPEQSEQPPTASASPATSSSPDAWDEPLDKQGDWLFPAVSLTELAVRLGNIDPRTARKQLRPFCLRQYGSRQKWTVDLTSMGNDLRRKVMGEKRPMQH